MINARAPYALLAGAESPQQRTPLSPWIVAPLQVGFVVAPWFVEAALRCSYSFDTCSDETCSPTGMCCAARTCNESDAGLGLHIPGRCSHTCSWPPQRQKEQMAEREVRTTSRVELNELLRCVRSKSSAARLGRTRVRISLEQAALELCRANHHRCRVGEVGPGAAGSFHSELQLDLGKDGKRHWSEAVEAVFSPSDEGRPVVRSFSHLVRSWVHEQRVQQPGSGPWRAPPPLLHLKISSRGVIAGHAPFSPAPYHSKPVVVHSMLARMAAIG